MFKFCGQNSASQNAHELSWGFTDDSAVQFGIFTLSEYNSHTPLIVTALSQISYLTSSPCDNPQECLSEAALTLPTGEVRTSRAPCCRRPGQPVCTAHAREGEPS